ncbi:MAG: class I SAM-dependent methyltransferase, partial [Patescibacteria group bacterium]|nr:class I SAM-dependent methyltransferase [Patescibacteria group bacterium]
MPLITEEIWRHPKTPAEWDRVVKKYLGLSDEIPLIDYIKNFGKKVAICDLGIGTGRLLKKFDKFKNISQIIGVDYSKAMLSFCQKRAKKCKKKVILLEDDLRNPVRLEK